MKQIAYIILVTFWTYSCNYKSNDSKNNKLSNSDSIKKSEEFNPSVATEKLNNANDSILGFSKIFRKAIKYFPNDSASLHQFYYEWFLARDDKELNRQIERLEKLTSNESVERYNDISNNLKPLLIRIVKTNSINKSQADSLITFYSDYDNFSGEALFSSLLTNDENYSLVWKSFR